MKLKKLPGVTRKSRYQNFELCLSTSFQTIPQCVKRILALFTLHGIEIMVYEYPISCICSRASEQCASVFFRLFLFHLEVSTIFCSRTLCHAKFTTHVHKGQ